MSAQSAGTSVLVAACLVVAAGGCSKQFPWPDSDEEVAARWRKQKEKQGKKPTAAAQQGSPCTRDLDCNDGNACTTDLCLPKGCANVDNANACGPDEPFACYRNTCQKGACMAAPVPAGKWCGPGSSACMTGRCNGAGMCVDSPKTDAVCSDGNPCTVDTCNDQGECEAAPVAAGVVCGYQPCAVLQCNGVGECALEQHQESSCQLDDYSYCREGRCQAGECIAKTRNEGKVCSAQKGCRQFRCVAGTCAPSQAEDGSVCGETSPCNALMCAAGKCTKPGPLPDGKTCNDGNQCTTTDLCSGGVCSGDLKTCDDDIACTLDWCVAKKDVKKGLKVGCNHARHHLNCNDGNACTADKCDLDIGCLNLPAAGTCTDDDACTDDSCHPDKGCVFLPKDPTPSGC